MDGEDDEFATCPCVLRLSQSESYLLEIDQSKDDDVFGLSQLEEVSRISQSEDEVLRVKQSEDCVLGVHQSEAERGGAYSWPRPFPWRQSRRWCYASSVLLIVLSLTLVVESQRRDDSYSQIISQFSLQESPPEVTFKHLRISRNPRLQSSYLYIGAVNRLFQLTPDLRLATDPVVTGPADDHPECSVTRECPTSVRKRKTDNHNKLLVVDEAQASLLACGSLFQGACELRDLEDIAVLRQEIREAVVANNATASTVGFIGPGPALPGSPSPGPPVLYVGVSYTGSSAYRGDVPAVASRRLTPGDEMLRLAISTVTTGTRMYVNAASRPSYPIRYVHGFSHDGFSYFLTVQMRSTDKPPFVSKLVRVCQNDIHYHSYTEIPIQCTAAVNRTVRQYLLAQAAHLGPAGAELARELGIEPGRDTVLYAVFAEAEEEGGAKPGSRSALCMFTMKSIRQRFKYNIQQCFEGKGERGLSFISPSHACTLTQVKDIEEDFCGMDVNTPLGGETAVEAVPVVTWDRPRVTSVTVTLTSDFTVAFCGTEDGRVKKIVIPNRHAAIEYEDILLDPGSPVQRDAAFDATGEHIYVMTQRRISKVRVQGCERYTKCGDCLGASDPYCGWCSLENRCTKIQDCKNAEKYWVAYKGENCTAIKSVIPNQLQRTTAVKLTLEIENLPLLRAVYQCVFTALGKTLVTEASLEGRNILCETPRTDRLPQIAPEQHHFTAKLAVRVKDGQEFADTDFTFFDCNTYTSCTQCVNSTFPCDWCVDGHRCTHDTAENCRNDVLVTGKERIGPSIRSGPNFCPRIKATSSRKHLVPAGSTRGIRVSVDNIAQFIVQTRFVCQFNVEGRVKSVSASLIGDMVYCDEVQFDYNSPAPNITASFAVIWGSSKTLDNPHNIQVLIYRCRLMANNCGLCLTLAPEYGCGWCQSSARCEIKDHCEMGKGIWLNQGQPCPNPQVTDFTPKYGVWEGKINVTIFGINLGRRFEDVQTGITVAGIPCSPFRETYVVTQSVTCYLDGPGYDSHRKGPVVVKVADFRGESEANFEFVNPRIRGFSPLRGPQSGGTHLTIEGDFMNAGSKIEAFIRNIPCVLVSQTERHARCVTSASPQIQKGQLRMRFDGKERELESPWFAYVDDPVIISVESGIRGQAKVAKGIPAGGITLNVKGRNLDIIQRPKMYIYYKDRLFEERCQILRADLMECVAPRVDVAPGDRLSADNPAQLEFGFLMDGVESVKNLSSKPGFGKFLLYPNPYFFEFEEKPKHYKSDYLTINGENLDRASHEKDVRVLIGNGVCNVTSLSRSQLTCRPPDAQPAAVDRFGRTVEGALPQVVALVGLNNLSFVIGELSYRPQTAADAALSQTVIIGMSVGGGVILLILFAIAVLYRRKSTENARVLKGMQEQMDVLELKVAAECKEAFAELQTEITDWTSDMTHGGIPFLDYRTYAMKILFPNIEEHPVMFPDTNGLNYAGKEQGIKQFGQLVLNKTFLLLFIRTLEGNKYFSMRDRVNVASLIMVALQGKMDYCTDVLKTLLADLIERCMNGKSHPKLLLRRTESVAEKMLSAWFTFLLYKFLRECAGEPLFLLYRATKQQVNKGPVDHFTSEARYSLSEEKLIRQSINYQPLTIYVSMGTPTMYISNSGFQTQTPYSPPEFHNVPVKVLNCDCISQVKEKCLDAFYRNTPQTQRPSKDELDLEWRTGNHGYGRIVLNDEDSTTKIEQGWKRINTLQHYEVKDGAVFNLVLRQSYPNQNNFNDTLRSHKYETLNLSKGSSPPASRATSPLNHENDNGSRWWHLVKHHDSHNDKDRGNKMVSEIYLTRLLSTKITLQKYVDDLFETIFSIAHRGSALPLAIKYLFDFLDDQAKLYGIMDPEVVHTWKSNSLPLRFWVNLIKNPNFVFDIQKSNIVDSCLSVIAQTFMDSCSTSQHRLGKESPSSKLLYAKDIPAYKDWVERYYHDIQLMPSISEQDMAAMLAEESRGHGGEFNVNAALMELYSYAMTHQEQLRLTLDEDEFSKKQRLSAKLNRVFQLMSAEPTA